MMIKVGIILTFFTAVVVHALRAPATAADRTLVVEEFDVCDDGDALFLPIELGGARYPFKVDTGATRVCYDRSLRPLLGLVRESEMLATLGGPVRCELFEAPNAGLGRLRLRLPAPAATPLVACLDQERERESSGLECRGILGTHFLRKHVVRIDFDRGKLAFLQAAGPDPGVRIPIVFDEGKREVVARLPGLGDSTFLIDTGLVGWSGCLRRKTARELERRKEARHVRTAWSADAAGESESRFLRVSKFEVAGFKHGDLIFSEHSQDLPNVLGLGYWMRYVVTFDFPDRAVYLKPSKWFGQPDVFYVGRAHDAGVGLGRRDGSVFVAAVVPESLAARGGLRPDDVLLALDGVNVAGERLLPICKRIYYAKQEIRFTVARATQRLDFTVKLPPIRDQ